MEQFDVLAIPSRFNAEPRAFFKQNGFITEGLRIMTEGNIVVSGDKSRFDLPKVQQYINRYYPDKNTDDMLVLDWESGPYSDMREHKAADPEFQAAVATLIALIDEIKKMRPNLKLSYYSIPYRTWGEWQKNNYNAVGKFDKIVQKMDFICPSLYILFTDEEVGNERNYQYFHDNLNHVLDLAKKYGKPVYPFMWHRIRHTSKLAPNAIMQKGTFARHVGYVAKYRHNGTGASGFFWWDGLSGRMDNLEGIHGYLAGTVTDTASYDAMIIDFAKHLIPVLKPVPQPEPEPPAVTKPTPQPEPLPEPAPVPEPDPIPVTKPTPVPAPVARVVSLTLVNAETGKDIRKMKNGVPLNLASLPTSKLNIRANTEPAQVGSVSLQLSGTAMRAQKENEAPYALFGNKGSDYNPWTPALGPYSLKVIPYNQPNLAGEAGKAFTVAFTVVRTEKVATTSTSTPVAKPKATRSPGRGKKSQ